MEMTKYEWTKLQRMPPEEVRQILAPLVEQYDDAELGEMFGVSSQQVGYLRRKVGLEKARGRGRGEAKSRGSEFIPFTISFGGDLSKDELVAALKKALRFVEEISDAEMFGATIHLTERAVSEDEEGLGWMREQKT